MLGKLVYTDGQISVIFPCVYYKPYFGIYDILFHILKSKFVNDYDIAIKCLNEI